MEKKTHMPKMIVKVQVPIFSTDNSAGCLVYDEERTFTTEIPATERIIKDCRDDMKNFYFAHWRPEGVLELDGLAPWQDW